MQIKATLLLAVAGSLSLTACGEGGVNSVASSPAPAPSPTPSPSPTPTPSSFSNNAATSRLAFDLSAGTTISGSSAAAALQISYDAVNDTYTVSENGRSVVFGRAELTTTTANDAQFRHASGSDIDYLTLVNIPYSNASVRPSYVKMGYWQHNIVTGAHQDTDFTPFTYGTPTAANAVPRIGSAAFGIDLFAVSALPGSAPKVDQGTGSITVDFAGGIFSASGSFTEFDLLTGNSVAGGGLTLDAGGHLSSSNGQFSGNMVFKDTGNVIPGTISGQFYGPLGNELGATFFGNNSLTGGTVSGALVGSGAGYPVNLTLTNLTQSQIFYTNEAYFSYYTVGGHPDVTQAFPTTGGAQLNYSNATSFTYAGPTSDYAAGHYTAADRVSSSAPNFTTYHVTSSGQDQTLDLYLPGSANTELALTYLSFGKFYGYGPAGGNIEDFRNFFVYGLGTPAAMLNAKTGSAHYDGVAYGAGNNSASGLLYDVKGTSQFDVNFTAQSMTGNVTLAGTPMGGGAAVNYGTYSFSAPLSGYLPETSTYFVRGADQIGSISTRFYGPDGEEIGGPFTLVVPTGDPGAGTRIVGVAVAKR